MFKLNIFVLFLNILSVSFCQILSAPSLNLTQVKLKPIQRLEIRQPLSFGAKSNKIKLTKEKLFGAPRKDYSKYYLVEKSFIENLRNFLKELTKTSAQHNLLISVLKGENKKNEEFIKEMKGNMESKEGLNEKAKEINKEIKKVIKTEVDSVFKKEEVPIFTMKTENKRIFDEKIKMPQLGEIKKEKEVLVQKEESPLKLRNVKKEKEMSVEKKPVQVKKEEVISVREEDKPLMVEKKEVVLLEKKDKPMSTLPVKKEEEKKLKVINAKPKITKVEKKEEILKKGILETLPRSKYVQTEEKKKILKEPKSLALTKAKLVKPVESKPKLEFKKKEDSFFSENFSGFNENFDFDNFIEKPLNEKEARLDPVANLDTKKVVPSLVKFPSFSDFLKTGELPEIPGVPLPRSIEDIKSSGLSEKDLENQMKEFLEKIRKGEIRPPAADN